MISQSEYLSYLPKIKSQYKEIVRNNKSRQRYRKPFGYEQHPKDKQLFLPDYEKLYALEKALEYIESGATFRAAADWLRKTSGEYVSHVALYYMRKEKQIKYEKLRKGIKRLSKEKQEELLDAARERASSSNGPQTEDSKRTET